MHDEPLTAQSESSAGEIGLDVSLGGRRFQVTADTVIYEAEMPALALFFIHDGQVRIYQAAQKANEEALEILTPGEWFGVAALTRLDCSRYGTRAVAVTPATVSEVAAARLLAALPDHPDVARELLSQMSSKLQRLWSRGRPDSRQHPKSG
jgi:CRP-like cAMP-binding protein